jgi:hypothetical protein
MNDEPRPDSIPRSAQPLSEWVVTDGFAEIKSRDAPAVRMSEVASRENVYELTARYLLQNQTLVPIVRFFIIANSVIGIGVFALALIETCLPEVRVGIITDKVIVALIGGLTVQVGAVIIAAFKGLFAR